MLQCPNCKEYCITYMDTFGLIRNLYVCKKCDGLFKISLHDVLKRTLIPMLTIGLTIGFTIYISEKYLAISSEYLIFIFPAIVFFLTDYYLYKNSAPLKKVGGVTEGLKITDVGKSELKKILEKLSSSKKKNSYITVLENRKFERYLDISYRDDRFIISLSLLGNNRQIESEFLTISEGLGFLVNRDVMNDVEFLEISLSGDITETVEILHKIITKLFVHKGGAFFTVLLDGIE